MRNEPDERPVDDSAGTIFDGWEELTWRERRERRFARWLSPPGVEFAGQEQKRLYQARVQGVVDAIELKKPERLPIYVMLGIYCAHWAGWTTRDACDDYRGFAPQWARMHEEFDLDFVSDPLPPTRVWELMGAKMVKWPGHGVGDDDDWQYCNEQNMRDDEYELLIEDPSDFWLRRLLPRFAEAYEPLQLLYPLTSVTDAPSLVYRTAPFADPQVVEGFQTLAEAGAVALDYLEVFGGASADLTSRCGMPVIAGASIYAPYDVLTDTLRGTKGMVMDQVRRPDKILAAAQHLVMRQVETALADLRRAACPIVSIPLHKGADGWMSDEDFRTFYWPTLKQLVKGLIDEGAVPMLFAEGSYNQRLAAVTDPELPAGSVIWYFENTDMVKARHALRDYACIMGNVPSSLLALGPASEVAAYTGRLLDDVAVDGGFILAPGSVLDDARAEAVKALIHTARTWLG